MADRARSTARARDEDRRTASEFEAWEAWYARQDYRRMPWYSPRPSPWLVAAVRRRWIPSGSRVLDVGCGSGSNVLWLAKRGYRASGVDIAPTVVAIARERVRQAGVAAELRVANATALPFASGAFGAVIDSGCFHSLPRRSRDRYAQEVYRVLRPHSPFLLTWIPREVRTRTGPPHRPSLAEVASVFEPGFVFAAVERFDPGSPGGWLVLGERFGRCTALLRRRSGRQPAPW